MNVETFECTETASEPIEASEEAIGLIDALELEGQRQLISKPESGSQTRCPYREMTKDERFVYAVLCPDKVKLRDYKNSPIPLRVLQIAAHANSLGLFEELWVWDRESAEVKDPVLVATIGSWSSQKTYILARWGEELETFSTLLQRAVASQREVFVEALQAIKARIDAEIGNAQGMASSKIVSMGADAEVAIRLPFEWDR